MRIALYTAIYGNYDRLVVPVRQNVPAHFFFFSETALRIYDLSPAEHGGRSAARLLESRPPPDLWWLADVTSTGALNKTKMSSVLFRCNPRKISLFREYDLIVYMDGNTVVQQDNFLSRFFVEPLARHPHTDIILSKHQSRDCIYQESAVSPRDKYYNTDFEGMKTFYSSQGISPHGGLYWNGLMGFRNTRALDTFQQLYTQEMFRWCLDPAQPYHPQGQVSLPYCLQRSGVKLFVHPPLYNIHVLLQPHTS